MCSDPLSVVIWACSVHQIKHRAVMISDLEVYIRSGAVAVGVFIAKIKSPGLV